MLKLLIYCPALLMFTLVCGCADRGISDDEPLPVPPAFETGVDLMEFLKDQFMEETVYCVSMKNGRAVVDYKHPIRNYQCSWMLLGEQNQPIPADRRIHYFRSETYSRYYFTQYDFRDAPEPGRWEPPTWISGDFYREGLVEYVYNRENQTLRLIPYDKEMLLYDLTAGTILQLNTIDRGSEHEPMTVSFDAPVKETCVGRFPARAVGMRVVWTKLWNSDVVGVLKEYKPFE